MNQVTSLTTYLHKSLKNSSSILKGVIPQLIFGVSVASCLYLFSKSKDQSNVLQEQEHTTKEKRKPKRSLSQRKLDTNQSNGDILADLKRSQLKLNKRITKTKQFDDSLDLTEDLQPRSPDYSVVSEIDQKFFQEIFQQKKKVQKNYQTDVEDGGSVRLFRSNKKQILKLAKEEQEGEDRMFFNLYSRVVEHPNEGEESFDEEY